MPKNGVFPEEIQLFFKRLRTKLDRRGISHNLRYIAVSEYGHWSKRPHYHIILWNFPDNFETAYSRLTLIESCWRRPTGEYNPDGSPVTRSIGFAYCDWETDRKSTRLNSSHRSLSRMPSSA